MVKVITEEESCQYELNKKDLTKIGKGAIIAISGVMIPALIESGSILLSYIAEIVPQINFGTFTPVAIIVSSILVNAGQKYLHGKKK